ncbi:TPA: hypothetical protein N0F65_007116 [Lagenidium giganteum]|uniref:Mitochondrial carrier protein n=1 Tax=Lagenidium giganteum TaxID=4803 RepID=A0AAV2YP05_9STRA|nr:TPA: hypothetical protein N0F65_007116 [Lagenidium giganteum]
MPVIRDSAIGAHSAARQATRTSLDQLSSMTAATASATATAADMPENDVVATSVEQSLAIVTAKNFVSGIVGGGCEAVVGYPLETVKARMQTQRSSSSAAFSGPIDCLQKSIKEGGVSSLYRGASPQIFRSAVGASVLFGLMGQYRYFFNKFVFDDKPQAALVAAGMATGLTEAVLYTPFEIIKIRMQTQYSQTRTRVSNWQCARDVFNQSGLRGIYRGFVPMAKREMVGNTAYFMSYETSKHYLHQKFIDDVPGLSPEQKSLRSYQAIAVSGGYAGFMYWLAVFPIDTVKSVMQADHLHNPRYSGVLDCCQKLFREDGIARFYRGISPTLVRAFPANAVTFVAFESCLKFLNQHF